MGLLGEEVCLQMTAALYCAAILHPSALTQERKKKKDSRDSAAAAAAALHLFEGLCGTSTIPLLRGEVKIGERILVLLSSSSRCSHMPCQAYLCERPPPLPPPPTPPPPPVAAILRVTHSGSFWLSAAEDAGTGWTEVNEGKVLGCFFVFFLAAKVPPGWLEAALPNWDGLLTNGDQPS